MPIGKPTPKKRGGKSLSVADTLMEFLAQHLKNETRLIYVGPDKGAHVPAFFATPQMLPKKFHNASLCATIVRTTAALYTTPHRVSEAAEAAWCIAADFDFDRGPMESIPRPAQEATLWATLEVLPPTAATQTQNGFHLYWILDTPIPIFEYAYTASLVKNAILADPHSVVPVHCLSFLNNGRKPAKMVDTIQLPYIKKSLRVFPHNIPLYTMNQINTCLQPNITPQMANLLQAVSTYKPDKQKVSNELIQKKAENTVQILEHMNVVEILRSTGYQAYFRGAHKIIMLCPYHHDRNPSAHLNLDPSSPYFGMFHCAACGTKTSLQNLLRKIGVDV